jgi:hypothetical protein
MMIKTQLQTTLLAALFGISSCRITTASDKPTAITANSIDTASVRPNSDSTLLAIKPKRDVDIYETKYILGDRYCADRQKSSDYNYRRHLGQANRN